MIEEVLLQTNSTVTTIVQQSAGVLSSAEWVTAVSSAIMMGATVVLAFYAYRTIDEGRKNRRKDSIEKQLEKLYSPMFEILDRAAPYEQPPYDPAKDIAKDFFHISELEAGKYYCAPSNDYRKLWTILTSYGHYLDQNEHDKVKQLLSQAQRRSMKGPLAFDNTYYSDINYTQCLDFIKKDRARLTSELHNLTRSESRKEEI